MKNVLITSGPTIEKIDPVRFISNFSSGKMGRELANAFLANDYGVTVVTGPVGISYPQEAHVISVNSAVEMLDACECELNSADVVVCCAAVCDYRPKAYASKKLKKGKDDAALSLIELVKNPDILKTLSLERRDNQVVIGFCAETENLLDNAKHKLRDKHCDMIVANDVSAGKVFSKDETQGFIVTKKMTKEFLCNKNELANLIVEQLTLF